MGKTSIEWTDYSFNPWWGCAHVSPGCRFCFAERDARRYGHDVWGKHGPRRMLSEWARDIRKQCDRVPLFVKQLGAHPCFIDTDNPWPCRSAKGGDISEFPADLRIREYPR